jgi:hypothetical protein
VMVTVVTDEQRSEYQAFTVAQTYCVVMADGSARR